MSISRDELAELGMIDKYISEKRKQLMCHGIKDVPASELDISKDNILKLYDIKDGFINEWCSKRNVDESVFERLIANDAKLRLYARSEYGHLVERYYLENISKYEQVVYTMLRHEDYFLIRELHCRIEEGESMHNICRNYSSGWEKHTLGVVGPSRMDQMHYVLASKLRAATIGEVVTPFKAGNVWLIVRKEFFQSAKLDENLRNRILMELLTSKLAEQD